VHLRLPTSQFDALNQQAQQQRLSGVPELIRRRLADRDEDEEE
jgi:hypothetical protein